MKRTIALACALICIGIRANADLQSDSSPQLNAIDGVCESLDRWVGQFGGNEFLTEEDFENAHSSDIYLFNGNMGYGLAGCLSDPTVTYYAPPEDLMPRALSGRSHRCITVGRHRHLESACAGIFPGGIPYQVAIAYKEEYCHVDFPELADFFALTTERGGGSIYRLQEYFAAHRILSDVAAKTDGPPFSGFFDENEPAMNVYMNVLSEVNYDDWHVERDLEKFDALKGLVFHNGDGTPFAIGYEVTDGKLVYYDSTKYRRMNLGGVDFTVSYRSRKDRVPSKTVLGKGENRRLPFELPYTDGIDHTDTGITVCYDKADGLDLHPAIKYMEFILKELGSIDELSFDFGYSHYIPFDG